MKRLLASAGALAIALCLSAGADAATFKPIAKGKSLVMTGKIIDGDDHRLHTAWADSCAKRGYCPERVFLNSPGGQVRAGLYIAQTVYDLGLDTVVGKTDVCASACFYVFTAGIHRVVRTGAHLGVHMIYDMNNGKVTRDSKEAMKSIAQLMRDVGVPERIVTKMIVTKPKDIYWVSLDDCGDWVEYIR